MSQIATHKKNTHMISAAQMTEPVKYCAASTTMVSNLLSQMLPNAGRCRRPENLQEQLKPMKKKTLFETQARAIWPDGEHVLWEACPDPRTLLLPLLVAGLMVIAGLVLLWWPADAHSGLAAATGPRLAPGLGLVGFGFALAFVIYRQQKPGRLYYQLTDYQLRIFRGDKLLKRVVRGELRLLRAGGAMVNWVATQAFTGNPSGFTQQPGNRLAGMTDPSRLLSRLANWTAGDESEAEHSASEFVHNETAHGREIHETNSGLSLRAPASWPVECRHLQRAPLRLFGHALPLAIMRRGALLPVAGKSGSWDGLRLRASQRSGVYIEISNRTSDQWRTEVYARWLALGPIQFESDNIPIAGFRGVIAEQYSGYAPAHDQSGIPAGEWSIAGYEDAGFGLTSQSAHRILLWATDGDIAIEIRAYAPSHDSASAQAIKQLIASIRREQTKVTTNEADDQMHTTSSR
jgi:hypothetical protein